LVILIVTTKQGKTKHSDFNDGFDRGEDKTGEEMLLKKGNDDKNMIILLSK